MIYEIRHFDIVCDECGFTAHRWDRCQIGVVFYPELPEGWQEKCIPTDHPGVWNRKYYCEGCSS